MRRHVFKHRSAFFILFLLPVLLSCSKPTAPLREPISWAELIRELALVDRIARLDVPGTTIITSYDRTGGNDDFNTFAGKGPPGWAVLADLKGPGYISRFWMTGTSPTGEHRIRIYLDGEEQPRWDTTMADWFGMKPPFGPPLAQYENYCWYSYIPIPFQKRVVIMTQSDDTRPGGWPRIFYQINYSSLPKGQAIESLPASVTADTARAIEEVDAAWKATPAETWPGHLEQAAGSLTLGPGAGGDLLRLAGPAVIRGLRLKYTLPSSASVVEMEAALRQVIVRMTWNDAAYPSVEVPLGDLFGSFWRRMRYHSLYFGLSGDTFELRFPMPFASSARISLENQSALEIAFDAVAATENLAAWDDGWGYFHASWNKTLAQDVGRPHDVLRTQARGKFVGCLLSATSFDKSWWLLEGDESIRVDGEETPRWLGTGLEDYFNGGWYYQNVRTRPLNGIPFKAPFRTVQYRLHLPDPTFFEKSIDMVFERGPGQASHGEMESVAFYYGDRPYRAPSRLGPLTHRRPPQDPLVAGTVMTELCNHERLGDYKGAADYTEWYLSMVEDFPFAPMLRLRQVAYVERIEGFEAAKPLYEAFLARETNQEARAQAESLEWFHEDPSHALLTMYCNFDTRAYLDGREVGAANNKEKALLYRVQLEPGPHSLVLEVRRKPPQLDWVQATLRTHQEDIHTSPAWHWAYGAGAGYDAGQRDTYSWRDITGTGIKGPPEVPFVWTEPNALVDTQSAAVGLRPPDEWPAQSDFVLYRTDFTIP